MERVSPTVFPKRKDHKYGILGRYASYFGKHHSDSTKTFSEIDFIKMVENLIDSMFVIFGGGVFQQTIGIPIGINRAPLLADLFLYFYDTDFIHGLLKKNERKLDRSFCF